MDKNDMLSELLERVVRIETKIDGYNNLREKINTTQAIANNNRDAIKEMKEMQRWLWRAFAGALIAGFIASIVSWQ